MPLHCAKPTRIEQPSSLRCLVYLNFLQTQSLSPWQERQPLLPDSIKLDASLVDQVESMVAAGNSGDPDPDLVSAQNKVRSMRCIA